ncbi:MAG: YfhO family protein [Candidatus Latescibacteria bacterium]|nr:YfhO family protein [Candidatus Latescibacterota bacterium]
MVAKRNSARSKRRKSKDGGTQSPAQKLAGWTNIPSALRDILVCFVIFLILVFVYRAYIIEGKIDVVADTINQGAPFDQFAKSYRDQYDATPLWYPHIFSGMPFQASGSYQSLQYSYEALLQLIVPNSLFELLHGRYLFHLLLGAISMFLLARALSLSRAAAFVAAVGFVLNSHVIGTDHVNRLASFMHIPLVFLTVYKLFERPHVIWAILLGGAFGSQLGSYHPQIAHYTGMMIGLYVVYIVIVRLREGGQVKPIGLGLTFFALGLIIAGSMAAVMVWPMQEYAQFSARNLSIGGQSVNVPFATSWSLSPGEILTFILPSFSGFGGQSYWGQMPFTDFPNYIGIIIAVLALLGLLLRRDRITVFLCLLSGFALFVSMGRHSAWVSYIMLNYVPFFAKFRAPVMILILFQFAAALLAGIGIQCLIDAARHQSSRLIGRGIVITAAALLSLTVLLTLSGTYFETFMGTIYAAADIAHPSRQAIASNAVMQSQLNSLRFGMLMQDLWMMAILLSVGGGLIFLYMRSKINTAFFSLGISVLATVDLLVVAGGLVDPQFLPGRVNSFYSERELDPVIQALAEDEGLFRVLPVDEPNTNQYGYFGISSIGGYHAAKMGVYEELMSEVGFNTLSVLNMLNTKYLITKQRLGGSFVPIVESSQGNLYRNDAALPRAFMVDSLVVIKEKDLIFKTLKGPEFRPSRYVILEEKLDVNLGPVEGASVVISNYAPQRIDLNVDTPGTGILVLSEIYYPAGWKATIDGDPTTILKSNYALRSVIVPAGQHSVSFVFEPTSFAVGHTLSRVASSLVLLCLLGYGTLTARRRLSVRQT